ncbi:glycosyltransferase family 9 protein [Dyadobacter tibetensis]|uniref:glycosyltransferase family 9 protein n=1 Tax=Dyadobacter tibetensis TaxID=1211851 RepID=UPI000472BD0A|nr:glycosyltransferase family 9 protein [Dyadobacter tibetensis]
MTIQRFTQLWTHRYYKYTHKLKAIWLGYRAFLEFWIFKRFRLYGRPLIAIIRTEHFGDIVAAEPISRLVRERYPKAHIVWFVKPSFTELVLYNPNIDQVYKEFCVTQRTVLLGTGIFDQVFELQFRNNNECPKCQLFRENPVAVKRDIHVGNYFAFGNLLQVFAQCGGLLQNGDIFPIDDQPRLALQPRHLKKAEALKLPTTFIAIHCQSNYAPKDWPADRWNQLVLWILDHYPVQIVEIGLKSNLSIPSERYTNLTGKLSIMETAAVIGRAAGFIGLDSGPSHLANALGVPGFILMGALNNFKDYNPYSGNYGTERNATLIKEAGLPCAAMSFEYVKDKVQKNLDRVITANMP